MWDPRPTLAKLCLDGAEKYEANLRANKLINPQIMDSILEERKRIHGLFQKLLPEFKEQISIVITNDVRVESCSVFSWNNHIYVLVSAALLVRPIDYPEDSSVNGWDWLALHETSHVKSSDLPWLFYTRKLLKVTCIALFIPKFLSYIIPSNHLVELWLNASIWLFLIGWSIQMIASMFIELKADLHATRSINDPLILEEAEKLISRMSSQATKRFPQPLGWLNYIINLLFSDPHPPLVIRRWLLRKRARFLKNDFSKQSI